MSTDEPRGALPPCLWLLLSMAASLLLAWPCSCHAQPSKWSVRGEAGIAMMVTRDQLGLLQFDKVGGVADVAASLESARVLDLQLGLRGAQFPSPQGAGRMLAPTLGLRVHLPRRPVTPYLTVRTGPAFTGALVRPLVGASAGVDITVRERFTVGPVVGIDDVVQWNGKLDSTDAVFFSVGLCVSYRSFKPIPPPPPPPPRKRVVSEPSEPAEDPTPELLALIEQSFPHETKRIELLAPVLFDVDSDTPQPLGVAMLHEVARMLRERTDIKLVEVQGYADARGNAEHNRELSQRRARAVVGWLIAHGIDGQRLTISGHGSDDPVDTLPHEGAYLQNRRVVFRVLEVVDAVEVQTP